MKNVAYPIAENLDAMATSTNRVFFSPKVVYILEIHFCVTGDLHYPRQGEWPSPTPSFHHEDRHTNESELLLAHL